jgi:hypothetical protein
MRLFHREEPMSRILLAPILALALAAGLATPARAELTAWDQAKVTALAKQLDDASKALYDTFYKQPKPTAGQQKPYYRLKEDVRLIKNDARSLARALEKGAGHDETQPAYEDLMQTVRRAQDNAAKVFTTKDLQDKAAAARALLNQITPYYDATAKPLEPVAR